MLKTKLVLGLVLFSFSSFAAAADCFKETQPFPWAACIHKGKSPDVLYHLHGKGLNEHAWDEGPDARYYPYFVRQEWAANGVDAPTVVTISLGQIWLLVEKNASPLSGLYEAFTQAIIPMVEARLGGVKGKRKLVGESMGGFNALQLAFKSGNLFERVAALCPPVVTLGPAATNEEIEQFIKRTGAKPDKAGDLVKLGRAFVPTPADWEKTSPLELVKTRTSTKLYLSCGSYDEYGIYEGNELLKTALANKRADFEWRPLYGGHCAVDIKSVATFLAGN